MIIGKSRMLWHKSLGMGEENYRFHDHENLAHYANAAADINSISLFGFKELEEFVKELILI